MQIACHPITDYRLQGYATGPIASAGIAQSAQQLALLLRNLRCACWATGASVGNATQRGLGGVGHKT